MKIEQLEQVVKIAEYNSISLAAENMFISQPNLSLSINKLEKELGFQIFTRTNKGVETTPLGQNFVDSAKIILLQLKQLKKMGGNTAHTSQKVFSLAHMHYRYVNHAVSQLFLRHEGDNLRIENFEGIRNYVEKMVEDRNCEIGLIGMFSHYHRITIKQLETRGLQYFRLCSSPVSVIVGPGSPLYSKEGDELTVNDIKSYPLAIFDEAEMEPYTSVYDELGLDNTRKIVVNERATLGDILDKTNAFSITTTNKLAYRNTDYYPTMRHFKLVDCDITGEIGWIKRADHALSETAMEFLELLSSYFTVVGGDLPI